MKVAIVHDYLYTYGGGERVLELFHDLFPEAPIYTLFYSGKHMPPQFASWDIHTTFLNVLPGKQHGLKMSVPVMPVAVESIDLTGFDLVISISSAFAKGILTPIGTCHIAYILTVPRFLWGYETSRQSAYPHNILLMSINSYLRVWDKVAADRPDYLIANSMAVQKRIAKSYGREADVIYSPVDSDIYSLSLAAREHHYLIVSRLEKYKNIELAIRTCNEYALPLKIIGDGYERRALESIAGPTIEFLGHVSDAVIIESYKKAKAVLFPGADDLGLVPIESQLCGTPVIAYKKDGALETVIDHVTGIFFEENTVTSLYNGIRELDAQRLDPENIRAETMRFSRKHIIGEFQSYITDAFKRYTSIYG